MSPPSSFEVIDLTGSDSEGEMIQEEEAQSKRRETHSRKRSLTAEEDNYCNKHQKISGRRSTDSDTPSLPAASTNIIINHGAINIGFDIDIDIDRNDGDNAIITSCIELPPSHNRIITCAPLIPAATSNMINMIPAATDATTSTYSLLTHVQQKDKWSCGFRNVQMILFFLLPNMEPDHPFHRRHHTNTTSCSHISGADTSDSVVNERTSSTLKIPSVKQIQTYMEQSWQQGFDPKGAHHFQFNIQSKKSPQIGAMEAHALFTFFQIDSTVVQFITCHESRTLMGPFVARYFDSSRRGWNCNIGDAMGTKALVEDLMDLVQGNINTTTNDDSHDDDDDNAVCTTHERACTTYTANAASNNEGMDGCNLAIAPLYLQWEGHSVTVVGIELLKENYQEYNLLVLDPIKKWSPTFSQLDCDTKGNSHEHGLHHMRLSSRRIRHKDHQLIVVSTQVQCIQQREERKRDESSGVVTAANQKVQDVRRTKTAQGHGYL